MIDGIEIIDAATATDQTVTPLSVRLEKGDMLVCVVFNMVLMGAKALQLVMLSGGRLWKSGEEKRRRN